MSTHEERAVGGVEVGGGAEEREPPLLLAAEQLGPHPDGGLGRVEEVVAVGGVARGGGGGHAHPLDAEAVHDLAVLAQHGDRALDGVGVEAAGGVDALAQAGDAHEPLEGGAAVLADEQPHRVGAESMAATGDTGRSRRRSLSGGRRRASARARAAGACDPLADRVVAAGEPVGVVGVQALDALAGAAHPAEGRGAGVVGGQMRRRARRRSAAWAAASASGSTPASASPARHPRTRGCRWRRAGRGRTSQ